MIEKNIVCQALEYTIYGAIEEFTAYKDFFNDLRALKSSDHLTLKINSPGGRVDAGLMIVDAIQECCATVSCHVVHQACSMGALIALSGNSLTMAKATFLMFHDYSGFSMGKGNELGLKSTATNKMWGERFRNVCCPFLSKAEATKILGGQDMYIHNDDESLEVRTKRHFK